MIGDVEFAEGQTPLNTDELLGLIPPITRHNELNELEQLNIIAAEGSLFARRPPTALLDEKYILRVHKRMFGEVWRWAGKFRSSDKNIGCPWPALPVELRMLLGDVKFWIEAEIYLPDEIGVRFHHRLVAIHLFPNGNGRHARMMADLLAVRLGRPRFSWGSTHLDKAGDVRRRYIDALRATDNHDIAPLLIFARE
jgi:Fic-DOC domain mobile mystery protein B